MKTFSPFNIKNILRVLPLMLGFLLVSCGSYHNNSYYDSDGIYSGSRQYVHEESSYQNNRGVTGSYFTQFQDYNAPIENGESVGIFTDVDSYYGGGEGYSTGHSGWGNSTNDVIVNVYDGGLGWGGMYGNWGWGGSYWNYGWGWNSWHNPHWGWGWNSWHNPYWGWNNGWGGGYYPYYGNSFHNRGYAYNAGPRGYYSSSDYAYRSRTMQQGSATRSVGQNRAYEVRGRGEGATPVRSDSRFTTNSTRSNTLGNTRGGNSTRNSAINNSRSANQNSSINNSRGVNQNRNSTINNSRNSTINNSRNNSINNSGNNNSSNRSGSFNNSTRSSGSPSMSRGGSTGGGRSSGMGGGGGSRSSGGGRR